MPNRISVFEHEYIETGQNGFERTHWKALADFNANHGSKYLTLYANGVTFNQFVGVIQAGNLTIEILPKIDRKESDTTKWRKHLLSMLKECSKIKTEYPELAYLNLASNSILDAYLDLFLDELSGLMHRGLIKRYRMKEENQTALKGQLLFPKHIKHNIVHQECFFVRHTVYDKEHKLHQVLYKALRLVRNVAPTINIRGKAERLLLDFPEMKDIVVSQSLFEQIQLDRKSVHYSKALLISKMLLLNYRPDITGGKDHVLALLFNMNRLWEEYVYHWLQKLNPDWIINYQKPLKFWQPENEYASRLKPDLVITNHTCGKVVIDTKWKVIEDKYPSDDDLQQMFAYAHYTDACHVILLYPSVTRDKVSGGYVKHHYINGKEQKVGCHILQVPLSLDKDNLLIGLDMETKDIEELVTDKKAKRNNKLTE